MCQSVPPFPFSEPEYTFCNALFPVDTHRPPGDPVSKMKLYFESWSTPPAHGSACVRTETHTNITHPGTLHRLHGPDTLTPGDNLQRIRYPVLACNHMNDDVDSRNGSVSGGRGCGDLPLSCPYLMSAKWLSQNTIYTAFRRQPTRVVVIYGPP